MISIAKGSTASNPSSGVFAARLDALGRHGRAGNSPVGDGSRWQVHTCQRKGGGQSHRTAVGPPKRIKRRPARRVCRQTADRHLCRSRGDPASSNQGTTGKPLHDRARAARQGATRQPRTRSHRSGVWKGSIRQRTWAIRICRVANITWTVTSAASALHELECWLTCSKSQFGRSGEPLVLQTVNVPWESPALIQDLRRALAVARDDSDGTPLVEIADKDTFGEQVRTFAENLFHDDVGHVSCRQLFCCDGHVASGLTCVHSVSPQLQFVTKAVKSAPHQSCVLKFALICNTHGICETSSPCYDVEMLVMLHAFVTDKEMLQGIDQAGLPACVSFAIVSNATSIFRHIRGILCMEFGFWPWNLIFDCVAHVCLWNPWSLPCNLIILVHDKLHATSFVFSREAPPKRFSASAFIKISRTSASPPPAAKVDATN